MSRWLPSPLLSVCLLLMWLLLAQSVAPAHLLLGAVLGFLAPLLARPLQPHGHPRIARPFAFARLLWLSAIEIVRSCFNVTRIILFRQPARKPAVGCRLPQRPKGLLSLRLLGGRSAQCPTRFARLSN